MKSRFLLLCLLLIACTPERSGPSPETPVRTEQAEDLQRVFWRTLRKDADSALLVANAHMDLATAIQDQLTLAKAANMLGAALLLKGDRAGAAEHFLDALERFEALGGTSSQALLHGSIADALAGGESSERANWHLKRSIDLYASLGDSAWVAGMTQVLAGRMLSSGQQDSAMALYAEARNWNPSAGSGKHAVMAIIAHVSRNADALAPQEIIELYRGALNVLQDSDAPMRCTILIRLGTTLLRTGANAEAGVALEEALSIAERTGLIDTRADAHFALNRYYRATARPEIALEHLDQYILLRDSIGSEERLNAMMEAEQRYALKEKDAELARNQVLLERRSQLIRAIGLAALLSVVAGAIAYWAYRQKKRSNAQLAEKNMMIGQQLKEKEILLREVHHRVKNNLQSISSLLRLQARTVKNEDAHNALLGAIARIKSILLIHQDLYRTTDLTQVDMPGYLHKLSTALNRDHGTQDRVHVELDVAPVLLEVESAVPIGLITNELITNALKHAFPGERSGTLVVRLKEEGPSLVLEIQDDGIGIPETILAQAEGDGHSGVGIITSIVTSMGAERVLVQDSGTLVRVIIPDPRTSR